MTGDFDKLAEGLRQTKEGERVLNSMPKLQKLASTDDGKRLFGALTSQNGDDIKKAAEGLKSGDTGAAADAVRAMLSSKEGRELASRLMEIIK